MRKIKFKTSNRRQYIAYFFYSFVSLYRSRTAMHTLALSYRIQAIADINASLDDIPMAAPQDTLHNEFWAGFHNYWNKCRY